MYFVLLLLEFLQLLFYLRRPEADSWYQSGTLVLLLSK